MLLETAPPAPSPRIQKHTLWKKEASIVSSVYSSTSNHPAELDKGEWILGSNIAVEQILISCHSGETKLLEEFNSWQDWLVCA